MDNNIRDRTHLQPCDELFSVKEFQHNVSTYEINIGETAILKKIRAQFFKAS